VNLNHSYIIKEGPSIKIQSTARQRSMSNNPTQEEQEICIKAKLKPLIPTIIPIILLVIALLIYFLYIHTQSWPWENAAQFGDMFGGVNAIFSGSAILFMAYSINLQRKDLKTQREAITLQTEELQKTAKAQTDSARYMDEQVAIMKASACLPQIDHEEDRIRDYINDNFAKLLSRLSVDIEESIKGDSLDEWIQGLMATVKIEESRSKHLSDSGDKNEYVRPDLHGLLDSLRKIKELRKQKLKIFNYLLKYDN